MVNYLFLNYLWELSLCVWMCRKISLPVRYHGLFKNMVWGSNKFICWLMGTSVKSTNSNIIRPHGKSLSICETFYKRMEGDTYILQNMKRFAWTDRSLECVWMMIRFSYLNLLHKSSRESSLQTNKQKKYVNSRVNSADT